MLHKLIRKSIWIVSSGYSECWIIEGMKFCQIFWLEFILWCILSKCLSESNQFFHFPVPWKKYGWRIGRIPLRLQIVTYNTPQKCQRMQYRFHSYVRSMVHVTQTIEQCLFNNGYKNKIFCDAFDSSRKEKNVSYLGIEIRMRKKNHCKSTHRKKYEVKLRSFHPRKTLQKIPICTDLQTF